MQGNEVACWTSNSPEIMPLDDFFTLIEMNDGLTSPSRVRELLAVMQKDRDRITNVGDATRQWSAFARTIVATENKECLNLFVQLDGLQFIDKWLKDSLKFSIETGENFVEESISHLLQALEKLQADSEKLVSSKVLTTLKDLLGHNSSKVVERAQALLDSWEKGRDSDASCMDIKRGGPLTDDDMQITGDILKDSIHNESSFGGAHISGESAGGEKSQQSTKDEPVPSTSINILEPDYVESAQTSDRNLDGSVLNGRTSDHAGSPSLSMPTNESGSTKMEPLVRCTIGTTSVDECNPAVARQASLDAQTDLKNLESDLLMTPKTESSPEKLGVLDDSKSFGHSSEAADVSTSVLESSLQKLSGVMEKTSCQKSSSSVDAKTVRSEGKDAVDDGECSLQCRSPSVRRTEENAELETVLQNSSTSEQSWENPKNSSTFSLKTEYDGGIDKPDLHRYSDGSDDALVNDYDFEKEKTEKKCDLTGKKSVVGLEYGIIDPLEVARQVAIEVERELVDFREQSCSSSEKAPEDKLKEPDSPDVLSGKRSHASKGSPKEGEHDQDLSPEASPVREESATSSENLDAELINGTRDMDTSHITEVAQEEENTARGLCNFDLNQEVYSEDTDPDGNQISANVSFVSASRATAAPGLPVAPLQFEGKSGWKGSAATSAFRPASPRRMPEGDKDPSTGESSSSSKQQQGYLDFDLNIAESEDGRTGEVLPEKHVPVSSTLLSGESSVEANSRSERLELDLNRVSEDGDIPSDWQINAQLFPKRNGDHNQTLPSSSSLRPLRNIDLNDQPSFLNDYSDRSYLTRLSQNLNTSGELKSDDSVISLMGTRVEVNRRDSVPQILPLPNGRTPDLASDVNLARSGGFLGLGSASPYAPSTLYSYNGISPGHAMPFSTMYGAAGPIPYTVDSRGAPVVPQIVGSASALPSAFSQPPFLISMASSTPPNGVVPTQGSFDFDSRLILEGGSRDPPGLGLFSNSGPFRSTDEQLRSYSQPFISSVVSEKRKEPDGGWEFYPVKHYTPPWKQS